MTSEWIRALTGLPLLLALIACAPTPAPSTPPTVTPMPQSTPTTPPDPPATTVPPSPTSEEPPAALVNGQPITIADYERELERYQASMAAQGIDPNSQDGQDKLNQARGWILDIMIEQVLTAQAAEQAGISVTDAQVEQYIQTMVAESGGEEALRVGFGSETSDISIEGVKSALEKARKGAVADPEFKSLARPTGEERKLTSYHDPKALEIKDADLVDAGWRVVNGALRVFQTSEPLGNLVERPEKLSELGLIVSGDVTILQERMAIASHAMPEVQTDESSLIMSFVTSMVEREDSKGSGYAATTGLRGFTEEAGQEAARK